jgi:vacuolar iron transporter family protein
MISRLNKARQAFRTKNKELSKQAHTKTAIKKAIQHGEEKHGSGEYIGSAVYGASDGIVTTFAIVSGVVGAQLSPGIILILGFANLLADGLSMAAGDYISTKSERDYMRREYEREKWETEQFPEAERQEIREIYQLKGFKGKDLDRAVEIITSNKKQWVETMVVEELGLQLQHKDPIKSGTITFIAFITAGSVPLLAYLHSYYFPHWANNTFLTASVLTGLALFAVGALRTQIIGRNWAYNGLEMLIIGGIASSTAYAVGAFLKTLA